MDWAEQRAAFNHHNRNENSSIHFPDAAYSTVRAEMLHFYHQYTHNFTLLVVSSTEHTNTHCPSGAGRRAVAIASPRTVAIRAHSYSSVASDCDTKPKQKWIDYFATSAHGQLPLTGDDGA